VEVRSSEGLGGRLRKARPLDSGWYLRDVLEPLPVEFNFALAKRLGLAGSWRCTQLDRCGREAHEHLAEVSRSARLSGWVWANDDTENFRSWFPTKPRDAGDRTGCLIRAGDRDLDLKELFRLAAQAHVALCGNRSCTFRCWRVERFGSRVAGRSRSAV
jgi:hypothetical protein